MVASTSKQEEKKKKGKKEGDGDFYDDTDEGKWGWDLGSLICCHGNHVYFFFFFQKQRMCIHPYRAVMSPGRRSLGLGLKSQVGRSGVCVERRICTHAS